MRHLRADPGEQTLTGVRSVPPDVRRHAGGRARRLPQTQRSEEQREGQGEEEEDGGLRVCGPSSRSVWTVAAGEDSAVCDGQDPRGSTLDVTVCDDCLVG